MAQTETHRGLVRRARRLSRALAAAYPDAHCELTFSNPLELTVATILSAQCTDKRVNQVTPALFERYPTAADYASADIHELQEYIRSTGFYKNKARSLMGLGEQLVEKYDGEVPGRLEDLVKLPGIGRKTANVVLGNAFNVPGLTVDTHFGRLVRRMGLTTEENPVIVEREIAELIERPRWTSFSHELIIHGRRVCHSRRAACGMCFLAKDCRGYGQFGPTEPDAAEKLVKGEERDRIIALAQEAMETGRMPDSRRMD